jgi:hypothetical protein
VPIVNTDLKIRYSGGASNSDQTLSIGGTKSSVEPTDNSLNNIFSDSGGTESLAGSIKYRCVYLHNGHGTLTAKNVRIYISTNSTSADSTWAIGLAAAGLNATETAVADENTAPASVTFSTPTTYAGGLAPADIPAGQHFGVWYRRTMTAGAAADDADTTTLKFDCDTNA